MPDTPSDSERWAQARSVAAELAESGVDPLDAAAATAARAALTRRFVLDLLLIFGVVAVVAAVGLMVYRAFAGNDPLGGREIWIASAALAFVLIVVVVRSIVPRSAAAYEAAWSRFRDRIWPGSARGDDLGSARLAFVRAAASGEDGRFPSAAPGRKA